MNNKLRIEFSYYGDCDVSESLIRKAKVIQLLGDLIGLIYHDKTEYLNDKTEYLKNCPVIPLLENRGYFLKSTNKSIKET